MREVGYDEMRGREGRSDAERERRVEIDIPRAGETGSFPPFLFPFQFLCFIRSCSCNNRRCENTAIVNGISRDVVAGHMVHQHLRDLHLDAYRQALQTLKYLGRVLTTCTWTEVYLRKSWSPEQCLFDIESSG